MKELRSRIMGLVKSRGIADQESLVQWAGARRSSQAQDKFDKALASLVEGGHLLEHKINYTFLGGSTGMQDAVSKHYSLNLKKDPSRSYIAVLRGTEVSVQDSRSYDFGGAVLTDTVCVGGTAASALGALRATLNVKQCQIQASIDVSPEGGPSQVFFGEKRTLALAAAKAIDDLLNSMGTLALNG